MTNFQISKEASYNLIVKEAKNYPEVVSLIPSFQAGINRLEVITNAMADISVQQAKDITGVTADKNDLMDLIVDYLVDVAGAVHSYAISRDDKILLAKVNYKESTVSKMASIDLITAASIVLMEVDKLAPGDLANEGIDITEINDFRVAVDKFKDVSSDPRVAIIDRSGYTQKLADLFAEANHIKKNTLDRLASQFRRKSPEFYLKYKAAATIIYRQSTKAKPTEPVK